MPRNIRGSAARPPSGDASDDDAALLLPTHNALPQSAGELCTNPANVGRDSCPGSGTPSAKARAAAGSAWRGDVNTLSSTKARHMTLKLQDLSDPLPGSRSASLPAHLQKAPPMSALASARRAPRSHDGSGGGVVLGAASARAGPHPLAGGRVGSSFPGMASGFSGSGSAGEQLYRSMAAERSFYSQCGPRYYDLAKLRSVAPGLGRGRADDKAAASPREDGHGEDDCCGDDKDGGGAIWEWDEGSNVASVDLEGGGGGAGACGGPVAGFGGAAALLVQVLASLLGRRDLTMEAAQARAMVMCRRAEKLLHRLTMPAQGWANALPAMPKSAVKYSQAMAVMCTGKVGAGVSLGWGSGFVVAKLHGRGAVAKWSAPAFFRHTWGSVGMSLGYLTRGCVVATMASPSTLVSRFLGDTKGKGRTQVGADTAWIMEYSDAAPQLRASGHGRQRGWVSGTSEDDVVAEYDFTDGSIIDASFSIGRWQGDDALNAALYGPGLCGTDILAGAVDPLPEFMSLYQLLNSYSIESNI